MFLVTRNEKPLKYETFPNGYDPSEDLALWESDEVTVFKTELQAAAAILATRKYEGGKMAWTQAEHKIVPVVLYKEKK